MQIQPRPFRRLPRATPISLTHLRVAPQDYKTLTKKLAYAGKVRSIYVFLLVLGVFPFLLGVMQLLFYLCGAKGEYWHPYGLFFTSVPLYVLVWWTLNPVARQYQNALAALRNCEDVCAVGPLIEMLNRNEPSSYRVIAEVLIRLLPHVTRPEAVPLFKQRQVLLCQALENTNSLTPGFDCDEALALAIVQMLTDVGNRDSIAYVRRTAETHTYTSVRLTARDCLPLLEQRVAHQQVSATLLRAADKENRQETLLRPAVLSKDALPEHLLRAHTSNGGGATD